jgi:hypothetical protein
LYNLTIASPIPTVIFCNFEGGNVMKKLLALLLAMAMAFALVACGGDNQDPPAQDNNPPAADDKTPADTTPTDSDPAPAGPAGASEITL